MRRIIDILLFFCISILSVISLSANGQVKNVEAPAQLQDSVMINFRQSKWNLDPTLGQNAEVLENISGRLTTVFNDSIYRVRKVKIYGGASPEGSVSFNKFLSEERANTLFDWFDKFNQLSDSDKVFTFFGRDWEGVLLIAMNDTAIPYREETLEMLRAIVSEKRMAGGNEPSNSLERIKRLKCGLPYRYLYRNVFPAVRASKVVIDYERIPAPDVLEKPTASGASRDTIFVERIVEVRDTVYVDTCHKVKR